MLIFLLFLGCAADPVASSSSEAPMPDLAPLAPADLAQPIAPTPSPTVEPSPSPTPAACPADTVAIDAFCMDRYEAPNLAGEKPLAMQTAPDGEAWCQARGKRLCTEAEWVRACQGPAMLPYPYGDTY